MVANPLVKLELLKRFRSAWAAWCIPLVIGLPGLAIVAIYATVTTTRTTDMWGAPVVDAGISASDLNGVGIGMFFAVLGTLLLTLLLLVPSTVGGSIAGERANQTLQPLQLTAMTSTQIVVGKLVSSLAYLLLLLLCAAPVMAVPFLLGGTSAVQTLGAYVVLVLITVEFAALSLAVSSLMARPAAAIVLSLVLCAVLVVGPWIAMSVAMVAASQNSPMFDAADSGLRYLSSFSPVALGSWVPAGEEVDEFVTNGDRLLSLVWYVVIVVGSLLFARRRVAAPVERDR